MSGGKLISDLRLLTSMMDDFYKLNDLNGFNNFNGFPPTITQQWHLSHNIGSKLSMPLGLNTGLKVFKYPVLQKNRLIIKSGTVLS
jgi:hypothetical protein